MQQADPVETGQSQESFKNVCGFIFAHHWFGTVGWMKQAIIRTTFVWFNGDVNLMTIYTQYDDDDDDDESIIQEKQSMD